MNDLRGARDSDKGEASYPPDHEPGMEVPVGGSMCKNCKYLEDPEKRICGNQYFIDWQRSKGVKKPEEIPGEIDRFCSDWWEGSETKPLSQREANKMSLRDILDSMRPAEEKPGSVESVT